MAQPIVSWYTRDNTSQITQWDIGTVDAGSISAEFGVLIWNNRGGSSDVSDMTNCSITTKDNAGGNTGELITDKWIEVKVDSLSEAAFSQIGGTTTRPIRGQAATNPAGVIKGDANNATKPDAEANYCELTLRANVPATASAGLINFLTRVSYQYV